LPQPRYDKHNVQYSPVPSSKPGPTQRRFLANKNRKSFAHNNLPSINNDYGESLGGNGRLH
jgi:hypothetical protein